MLRMKMTVGAVKRVADSTGAITAEEIDLTAVYSSDPASANAQWSKYTPSAQLRAHISNPAAFGRVLPGQFVFVDITPADKES